MEITDERIAVFLSSFDRDDPEILRQLRKEAQAEGIPIIRRQTQRILEFMTAALSPGKILEIGTAVGFSSIVMAYAGDRDLHITTIEKDPDRVRKAEENIRRAGAEDSITVLRGNAEDILPTLEGPFDLVFLDAAKAQYIRYLEMLLPVMKEGSVLISDNCLQDGDVTESRFVIERRDRTIHKRMREYLLEISRRKGLVTTILPVGDGVALSAVRREII